MSSDIATPLGLPVVGSPQFFRDMVFSEQAKAYWKTFFALGDAARADPLHCPQCGGDVFRWFHNTEIARIAGAYRECEGCHFIMPKDRT